MDQIFVTVENIQNPSVKRKMTLASAKINSKKWKIVEGQEIQEPKKEVAVDAVKPNQPPTVIQKVTEPEEFAKITDPVDEELESLRTQYLEKSGKPADKRWKAEKLTAKIAEL